MRDDELAGEAKRLIDVIAAMPRFAGSAEETSARNICANELRAAGLTPTEREFEFSEWPGRWGIPFIAAATLFAILITALAATRTALLGGAVLMFAFPLGHRILHSARDNATQRMRALRSRSVNLEATRGTRPRVWLIAHLDSKSQSVPMLVRVASHVALIAVALMELATIFLLKWGAIHSAHWGWIAVAGFVAGIPSLLCFVGNASQGALDNATGVAAVLLAARLIPANVPYGVLITSGEELDLAGARAWATDNHAGAVLINCDTVDDSGAWRCMYGNRPHALGLAAEKAAKKLGLSLRMGKMIPGIVTDSVAFEAAGLPSVTISRGTLRTLARVHSRGDNPDRLAATGAATAARILAQMVEELS